MTTELWLLSTAALTALMWVPYVLDRMVTLGVPRTLGNPQRGDAEQQSAWAQRAKAAHSNAIENFAVYAPVAILALVKDVGSSELIVNASAAYFVGRVVHYVAYVAGIPVMRTLGFITAWGAVLAIVWGVYAG